MNHALRFSRALVAYFLKTFPRVRGLSREDKRKFLVAQVHTDAAALLRDLNFDIKVIGYEENVKPGVNYLTVGNHLSYMDPFIMVSVHPALFVTSVDMQHTPVLGQIVEMAGCIFVERRNRTTIEKDIAEMTESLKAGMSVAIYPEGGTTDGRNVAPFKKSLLMSAVFAGVDILPVAIKYTEIDGVPVTDANLDLIAWHGTMGFGPHFMKLMRAKNVKVELHFLPAIKVSPDSKRDDLARASHAAVQSAYLAK